MANIFTAAGATLSIGTTAASGATDTYTTIANVTDIPEFGRNYNIIKVTPLSTRGTLKIKGSFEEGDLAVKLLRDPADPGQAAAILARDIDSDFNFKIGINDAAPVTTAPVTITIAAPGVVTDTAHGLSIGTQVSFATTGALPIGLTAATPYFIIATGFTANSYQLALTAGGSAITTSGTQSGVHTRSSIPVASNVIFKAKVTSYTLGLGTVDSPLDATLMLALKSGSSIESVHLP